jgi:GNAT superfamily N-acetyltransferase
MTYQVVRYSAEFRPSVLNVLSHLLGSDRELVSAYFRWKHEENPYTHGPIAYLVLQDGEIVAMRAFKGGLWTAGDGKPAVVLLSACDLVVVPEHRRRGLFTTLMDGALADLAARGFGPVINWSANPITFHASLGAGWILVGPYRRWMRDTFRARHVRRLRARIGTVPFLWRYKERRFPFLSHRGFSALDAAWARNRLRSIAITASARPDDMAHLVREAKDRGPGHVRDGTYYGWRFRNPANAYRFVFSGDVDLDAFLVLQVSRMGLASDVAIVDWQARDDRTLSEMLALVVRAGGYDSLSIWSAGLPAEMTGTLPRLGFAAVDDSRGIPEYRPGLLAIGPGGAPLAKSAGDMAGMFSGLESWNLRMVYSDAY